MKCFQCEIDVTAEDSAIQCDGCKRNVCLTCSNLTSSEMRVMGLKARRTLLFLCTPCREALFQVPKLIKSYDTVREELNEIKTQLAKQTPTQTTSIPLPTINTNSVIEEMAERERRANNIIIVGIEESNSADNDMRKAHDESILKDVLQEVTGDGSVSSKVVKVLRLGQKGNSKPRPLKVILKNRSDAINILKNKKKAQKEVRFYNDRTPQQREELNQLRQRLKERMDKGETDITIKYISGVPKIIKLKN